jgi:ABC-type sulfate transport system substrate-binding protein
MTKEEVQAQFNIINSIMDEMDSKDSTTVSRAYLDEVLKKLFKILVSYDSKKPLYVKFNDRFLKWEDFVGRTVKETDKIIYLYDQRGAD